MIITKNKNNIITILFVFTLSLLPIYIYLFNNDDISSRIDIVKKCLSGSDTSLLKDENVNLEFDIEKYIYLSDELNRNSVEQDNRNKCAVEALGLPKNSNDVEIIMRSLISAAKSDKNVQVACHEIGHELGMRTWRELGKPGLVLGLELCTYGFYHGYMRAAIVSSGGASRIPFLVDFCKKQA